jgi:LacI family transcriptional regulator
MASIKDVATKANVSISTVSNVINNTKYVSYELKVKVFQAIEELSYVVDPIARSLKSKRTMIIGVVVTNIHRIFYTEVLKGIQDVAEKHGYNLLFCNSDDKYENEKRFIRMMENNQVDGVILDSVADMKQDDYFKSLSRLSNKKKHIPVVSLERRIDKFRIDCVGVDNRQGGELATKHLIDNGCRKILHIAGPLYSDMAHNRLTGYKEELLQNGLPFDERLVITGDFSPLSGHDAMKKTILGGNQVDGVFAANDQMAIGAIKAMKEHGYRVPEDIKVVGFDNAFVASLVEPSLTTISVPKYRMGATTAEMIIKKIEGEETESFYTELPINLIVRCSTNLRGESGWDLYGW